MQCVPLRSAALRLALRVLRASAGLAPSDLLALDLAGVARHETRLSQGLTQRLIVLNQRAGDPMTNGSGLASDAAAIHMDADIEFSGQLHGLERLTHDHA